MEVLITKPDGTTTNVKGTPEEIKDFFGVSDLPNSLDKLVEDLEPGVYAVTDDWTPGYITRGKFYKVSWDVGGVFTTVADDGIEVNAAWSDSAHLNGGNWRKVVVE